MGISSFSMGFIAGFGTGFLSREAIPFAREIISPISRVTMKSTVRFLEKSKEAMAHFAETVEDTIAEVRQDLRKEKNRKIKRSKKSRKAGELAKVTRIA